MKTDKKTDANMMCVTVKKKNKSVNPASDWSVGRGKMYTEHMVSETKRPYCFIAFYQDVIIICQWQH